MTTEIVLTCDRCKKNVKPNSDEQFWEVGIVTACRPRTIAHKQLYCVDAKYKMEVCRDCIEDFGMVPSERTPPPPAPPSLEDMIFEIVQNAVER